MRLIIYKLPLISRITQGADVGINVSIDTGTGVSVEAGTGVSVGAGKGVSVGTGTSVSVGTGIGVSVGIGIGVSVGMNVGVSVGIGTGVLVGMSVGVLFGVLVGDGRLVGIFVDTNWEFVESLSFPVSSEEESTAELLRKASISSIAAPGFVTVILMYLARTGLKLACIVSEPESTPVKPAVFES